MKSQDVQTVKKRFGLIGRSPKLDHALHIALQVASTEMSVLIHGPSGTGKESFSRIIHEASSRRHNTFIAVNCGAIPEGTIDSELFGHEKGAFTGASDSRKGYFEVANKGTIFLDEVGEMPLSTQARLLRVLENGEYIRVGASYPKYTDIRVIAATHVNLYEALQEKKFREDLYYRLNTVPIYVPSLAERKEDIPLLFEKFSLDFAEKYRRTPLELSKEANLALQQAHFPGNIRELKNIAEQISLLEVSPHISLETLRKYLPSKGQMLPVLSEQGSEDTNPIEQKLLYQILIELRQDVNDLKKLTYNLLHNTDESSQLLAKHPHLFSKEEQPSTLQPLKQLPAQSTPRQKIEDITPENDFLPEKLSLESLEKEVIEKALERHQNRRKQTAKELGISERTLYRKIKYYGLAL